MILSADLRMSDAVAKFLTSCLHKGRFLRDLTFTLPSAVITSYMYCDLLCSDDSALILNDEDQTYGAEASQEDFQRGPYWGKNLKRGHFGKRVKNVLCLNI